MDRLDIINHLLTKTKGENYLEIGVFTGYTLDGAKAKNKIGVDPQSHHYKGSEKVFTGTSNDFFASLDSNIKYNVIFIDGLHEGKQVAEDIENALKHLETGGYIVLHDMNPPTFAHTTTGVDGCWTGDCYKAVLEYGSSRPFSYKTVDTDWGVGILQPFDKVTKNNVTLQTYIVDFSNHHYGEAIKNWEYFDENRKELMNIISVEEFKNQYPCPEN